MSQGNPSGNPPNLRKLVATPAGTAPEMRGYTQKPPTPSSGAVPKASRIQLPPMGGATPVAGGSRPRKIDIEERNRMMREMMSPSLEDSGLFDSGQEIPASILRAMAMEQEDFSNFPQPAPAARPPPKVSGIGRGGAPETPTTKTTVTTIKDSSGRTLQSETVVESVDSRGQRYSKKTVETVKSATSIGKPQSATYIGRQPLKAGKPPTPQSSEAVRRAQTKPPTPQSSEAMRRAQAKPPTPQSSEAMRRAQAKPPTPQSSEAVRRAQAAQARTTQVRPTASQMSSESVRRAQAAQARSTQPPPQATPVQMRPASRYSVEAILAAKAQAQQSSESMLRAQARAKQTTPSVSRKETTVAKTPGGGVSQRTVESVKKPGKTVTTVTTTQQKPGGRVPTTQAQAKRVVSTSSMQSVDSGRGGKSLKIVTESVESMGGGVQRKKTRIVESKASVASSRGSSVSSMGSRKKPSKPGAQFPAKVVRMKKAPVSVKPNLQQLNMDIERELREMSMRDPNKDLKATGAKTGEIPAPKMKTPRGEVEVDKKVISSKSVIREPGTPEIIVESLTGIRKVGRGRAEMSEVQIQKLSPKAKTPANVVEREVSQVLSSVATGGGYVEKVRTVKYDGVERPPKKPQLSPEVVAQMVAEENAEIEKTADLLMPELEVTRTGTYPLKRNVEEGLLRPESVTLLEKKVTPPMPAADDIPEEPEPEIIASMMNTEERGLNLDSAPANVYDYLFVEESEDCLLNVSSVAAAPLNDIVFPMNLVDQALETMTNPEALKASRELQMQSEAAIPEDLYVETVGKTPPETKNTATKLAEPATITFKGGPLLCDVVPPWGIKDYVPAIDLVGAPPAPATSPKPPDENTDKTEEANQSDPKTDGIEYTLQIEPPRHFSKIQLRGSGNPSWFPGYYLALPKIPEILTVVKSPSMVFTSAWTAMQPSIFAEDSIEVN